MARVGAPDLTTIAGELRRIEQAAHDLRELVEPRAVGDRRPIRPEPDGDT